MRRRRAAAGAVLLVLAGIAYAPVWRAGFVWNDADYVTRAALRSWHGLLTIWTKPGATEQYYPLLHSAFWLEYHLWGAAPLGYHLINVLLHALSALLLWRIVAGLAGGIDDPRAGAVGWLAAALFTVHPVMVESVAWISEQKNTLSLVFYLLAAHRYLRERRGGLALFVCALLCKTVTATLPAALLVALWWTRSTRLRAHAVRLLPWFAAAAAAGLFSAWVERTYVGARGSEFMLTAGDRLLLACRIPWFYLGKLLWPAHLVFIYPRWDVPTEAAAGGIAALATLLVAVAGAWWARRSRGPLAAWLFFLGSLFPTLGFFNVYAFIYSYVADHWDYLPAIAVFVAAAEGLVRLPAPWRAAAAAMVLGALTVRAFQECGTYRNAGVFYATIVSRNPDAWMAQNNLGELLAHAGRPDAALAYYEAGLARRPAAPEMHYNRGLALAQLGRTGEAASELRTALTLSPGFALARTALAQLDNASAVAENNAGVARLQAGDYAGAAVRFEAAVRLDPLYAIAWANLGRALFGERRVADAVAPFEESLRLQPSSAETENDLGAAFAFLGRPGDAIPHYEASLRLRPGFAPALKNLAAARRAANNRNAP